MCNRFALPASPEEIADHFELTDVSGLLPRYNVAPGEEITVVLEEHGARAVRHASWGLRPSFRRHDKMLNVRAESLRGRRGQSATTRSGRALVPAGGFFEWRRVGRARQPFYYRLKDSPLLALGALCEPHARPDGRPGLSCAILTTAPNSLVAEVHDRMPAIIPRESYGAWLSPATPLEDVLSLLRPFPADEMTAYAVSSRVNRSGVDDPRLIEPAPRETLF